MGTSGQLEPRYEEVCSGRTGHAEVVLLIVRVIPERVTNFSV